MKKERVEKKKTQKSFNDINALVNFVHHWVNFGHKVFFGGKWGGG